jgi:hypothetical protein
MRQDAAGPASDVFVYHVLLVMRAATLTQLLTRLESGKRRIGVIDAGELRPLLVGLGRKQFADPQSLARFHDALLFLRAFPPNAAVMRQTEKLLATFAPRITQLRKTGADLSPLDEEEFSGIAGTTLSAVFHYDQVRWLAERFPKNVDIDWEGDDQTEQMAAALPRFLPLLKEDSLVEADVPYRRWLREASGGRDLAWLMRQCERLPLSAEAKAEIYGAMELSVRWDLGDSLATRTRSRHPVRQIFYHTTPLIQRSQVSLVQELSRPPLKIKKLSRREGERILDLCREATTVRYRELYGTTRGDPAQVVQAEVGRGVKIFLWGLPPERRLPLRAYQAGFTLKNGVPINYIEGISFFEWMEIGFNTFFSYRDGETAWIYAQALRLLHQILGVTCISVYPYQIGQGNEEAIKSGAFWFYRKLGFRPMRAELAKIVAAEEKKIAANQAYRTSLSTLRRLAQGHVVLELPGSSPGEWDHFRMRNLGFAVQRRMAARFGGDAARIRRASASRLARVLGVDPKLWPALEQKAFENFALVLSLVPGISRWTREEKEHLVEIIRAKSRSRESRYAHLAASHGRLRAAIRQLGSIAHR